MYRFMFPTFNGHELMWMATVLESVPDRIPSFEEGVLIFYVISEVIPKCNCIGYS